MCFIKTKKKHIQRTHACRPLPLAALARIRHAAAFVVGIGVYACKVFLLTNISQWFHQTKGASRMMWTMTGHVHQRCSEKDRIFHHSCPPLIPLVNLEVSSCTHATGDKIATSQTQKPWDPYLDIMFTWTWSLEVFQHCRYTWIDGCTFFGQQMCCAAVQIFLEEGFPRRQSQSSHRFLWRLGVSVLLGWSFSAVCFFLLGKNWFGAGVGGLKKHK